MEKNILSTNKTTIANKHNIRKNHEFILKNVYCKIFLFSLILNIFYLTEGRVYIGRGRSKTDKNYPCKRENVWVKYFII